MKSKACFFHFQLVSFSSRTPRFQKRGTLCLYRSTLGANPSNWGNGRCNSESKSSTMLHWKTGGIFRSWPIPAVNQSTLPGSHWKRPPQDTFSIWGKSSTRQKCISMARLLENVFGNRSDSTLQTMCKAERTSLRSA